MSKFKCQEIYSETKYISPSLAEEMLDTSIGNRRIRDSHVKELAGAIKRDEWRATSQGIGFDCNGNLRDGHHRLKAIVFANKPAQMVITYGLRVDAHQVTDIGIKRNYADLLNTEKRVAEVIRLAGHYYIGTNKPSVDQLQPIIDSGFLNYLDRLINYCGLTTKYYASAPMRLAACISMIEHGNINFVLLQYKALCHLDYELMTHAAQLLDKKVRRNQVHAARSDEVLSNGFMVFEEKKKNFQKIYSTINMKEDAKNRVKKVITELIAEKL